MIAGFERPDEGQILLDGVDMAQTPPHKRNVNTVFQNYALFPHLTVAENVGVRPAVPGGLEAGGEEEGGRRARAGPALGVRAPAALAALGWPAAARRARARADPQPGRPVARRAARSARRQAAEGAADRAEGAPGGDRHHVRLRHARPGGGAHDVGPPRRDEQRPGRAVGDAVGGVRGADDDVRGRLPRRVEPHGRGRRRGRRRRTREAPARGVRTRAVAGRHRCPGRRQGRDPARAGAPRALGDERREPGARAWSSASCTSARSCR